MSIVIQKLIEEISDESHSKLVAIICSVEGTERLCAFLPAINTELCADEAEALINSMISAAIGAFEKTFMQNISAKDAEDIQQFLKDRACEAIDRGFSKGDYKSILEEF